MSEGCPAEPALSAREAAIQVARRLHEAGHVAYFAGGCVRDALLELDPQDFDVATDARPETVQQLFRSARLVGEAFGVVLVRCGGRTIEVATFRSDGPYHDGRRPQMVHFSSPQEDAQRRDFTVNGLFQDPSSGEVIDFVGGRDDLSRGVIRAIGSADDRIAEDRLRTIRAVRFSARLGFTIDGATMEAIRAAAPGLQAVSRERIGIELRKMLAHPTRGRACQLLEEALLDGPTLAEPCVVSGAPSVGRLAPDADWVTALAAWRADRRSSGGEAGTGDAAAALVLSTAERQLLEGCEQCLAMLPGWLGGSIAARMRQAASRGFLQALEIARAQCAPGAASWRSELEALAARPGGLTPPSLVTGDDLTARGLKPGPAFKVILDAAYDRQLEGGFVDRDSALAALEEQLRTGATRP
ncbi:MAG: CCA tRNA nucleotidyltransferase [Planctomycetota bacterium]|nr:CCA tRNA nucleotidyltransferase [Planctomycetota bacterium]MDA1104982.1 CCA tRNA nucleotidyltransferase [Planctomycetota bacterium]